MSPAEYKKLVKNIKDRYKIFILGGFVLPELSSLMVSHGYLD